MKYLPIVWRYLQPYRSLGAVSLVLIVLQSLASLLGPWPLKILIDNVLGQHPLPSSLTPLLGSPTQDRFPLLVFAVVAGVGVVAFQNLLTVVSNYVHTKLKLGIVLDFRSHIFEHSQRLSMAYHDQRRSGSLIYAINNLGESLPNITMAFPSLAQSVLTLVGIFWIVLQINQVLALLSLTIVPLLYYSTGYYMTRVRPKLHRVKAIEGGSLQIVHEAISMLRVIVAFSREDHESQRFRSQSVQAIDARVKITVSQTIFSLAVNMITATGTALVLGFGAYQALQGTLTTGQLLVVMSYTAAVYKPLEAISFTVGYLQDQFISLQIALDVLNTDLDIKDSPDAVDIDRTTGQITFEGVHFNYNDRTNTLKDISFVVEPSQVVGIVGPTGAGKTTLASLIPRFYDPEEGHICLDGIDIRHITLKSLRQQTGIVLQEPLLFSGTIADNIRYGRLDADLADIKEAAQAANAHDFIMALPHQYETIIGERGAQLSGGERQRISIARAFLKDAPILILDEPTASIDSKTEAVILNALERLMVGRTTFMIAHRLSTIRHADIILVLDRGHLVEQGTHESLLERDGLYRQLYMIQNG
jgi:ABC-type multidrug transport system fused ATPase/permease subunit